MIEHIEELEPKLAPGGAIYLPAVVIFPAAGGDRLPPVEQFPALPVTWTGYE